MKQYTARSNKRFRKICLSGSQRQKFFIQDWRLMISWIPDTYSRLSTRLGMDCKDSPSKIDGFVVGTPILKSPDTLLYSRHDPFPQTTPDRAHRAHRACHRLRPHRPRRTPSWHCDHRHHSHRVPPRPARLTFPQTHRRRARSLARALHRVAKRRNPHRHGRGR